MRLLATLILPALLVLTSGCTSIDGSGNIITEEREVSGIERIEVSGSGEVILAQGDDESLRIETDDNVMEYVKAEMNGSTLELGFRSEFRSISPSKLTFYVSVEVLESLSVSGSGEIESDRIETDSMDISISGSGSVNIAQLVSGEVQTEISGSGEIDLAGETDSQDIDISGSGEYRAGELCGRSVKVKVSGSGDATVCAEETLEADISGSGSVSYYGRPAINMSGSGSGEVNSLGVRE